MGKLFGTSGIRGIFGKEITLDLALKIGKAVGTYINEKKVAIARDPRTSSVAIENSVISGLESAGKSAIKLGMVPTPTLSFSARKLGFPGIMITASHNPAEYNGLKVWNSDGTAFNPEQEQGLEKIIFSEKFKSANWNSIEKSQEEDFSEEYIKFATGAVEISRRFKISLDCGNGACSIISPLILEQFSSGLETIFTETHGIFPRELEPSKKGLEKLSILVRKTKSDIGFAHDGDGDRLAAVDEKGNLVEQDKLLALLMKNELEGTVGSKIVVPIDTSKLVEDVADEYSAKVIYSRVGDVYVAQELMACGGAFGGEPSGCFIFPKIHMCPDGMLSALKILEFLSYQEKTVSGLVSELPEYRTVRKVLKCRPSEKEKIYKKLAEKVKKMQAGKIIEIDGIRADFPDGWVLARQSGTEPKVRVTAEAKTAKKAKELLSKILK